MLHTVERNQRACSSEARLTVDRNGAFLFLSGLKELVDNVVWGRRTIQEIQIQVINIGLNEFLTLVLRFVQSHH